VVHLQLTLFTAPQAMSQNSKLHYDGNMRVKDLEVDTRKNLDLYL
jgi:hypothetical protein